MSCPHDQGLKFSSVDPSSQKLTVDLNRLDAVDQESAFGTECG